MLFSFSLVLTTPHNHQIVEASAREEEGPVEGERECRGRQCYLTSTAPTANPLVVMGTDLVTIATETTTTAIEVVKGNIEVVAIEIPVSSSCYPWFKSLAFIPL